MATDSGGTKNGISKPTRSWADMIGKSLPQCWNKNVLEIVLEKDFKGPFLVNAHECARLMTKIGLDTKPGVHMEEVQICPNGKGSILITLKSDVSIGNFCRHEVIEVTQSGIRAVHVKPAGRREVIVTIRGLHPNTMDHGVITYLKKFSDVVSTKVVYGVYSEGPLVGLKNGDRSYRVEIGPRGNIGSYHMIDGHKVTLKYLGQQQTCARCHETAKNCKGGAIAKKCEAANGPKVDFSEYIFNLWSDIGYHPEDEEIAAVYDDHGENPGQQVGGEFTPIKIVSSPEKYGGVSIRQFLKDTDPGDIMQLLVESGLPEEMKDNVIIHANGQVIIRQLENDICLQLIHSLHGKIFLGRKIYCNGIIPLTPEKENDGRLSTSSDSIESCATSKLPGTLDSIIPPSTVPSFLIEADINSAIKPCSEESLKNVLYDTLVRRHSISLRTPPKGSLGSEILQASNSAHLERTKSIIDDIKDRLSDFASCNELSSALSSSEEENAEEPKLPLKPKKGARNKRRASQTPPKEFFLKKGKLNK